jgi:hypothetical protein
VVKIGGGEVVKVTVVKWLKQASSTVVNHLSTIVST